MTKEKNDVWHKILIWSSIAGLTILGIVNYIFAAGIQSNQLEMVRNDQNAMKIKLDAHDKSITTIETKMDFVVESVKRIEAKIDNKK